MIDVAISVPFDDSDSLEAFPATAEDLAIGESRSIDGNTLATIIVPVALASLPVLKAWLIARVEAKKGCVVSFDGATLHGYSADEVERITAAISSALDDRSGDAAES